MNTTIAKSGLTAIINDEGAELISLTSGHREYVWEGNATFWGKHAPVLFPIVGALKNNRYFYNGKTYNLPRHGFAREQQFELLSQSECQVIFSLKNNANSLIAYPFQFELQISYTLNDDALTVGYTVINHGNSGMPFSIGAHPAIALPGRFESYGLQFSDDEKLVSSVLENNLISDQTVTFNLENKTLPLSYSLFKNDALILKDLKSSQLTVLSDGFPMLRMHFKGFPNFGIWTMPNAPFICLEPWFGYADSQYTSGNILHKEGIRLLNPKSSCECRFSIEIL